ncbi:hypothetical protein MKX01_007659 [Papaver californicum]|nr:hypothetical protein MKX01_020770 [Papaver californicum]KAI3997772.1 hypothetical protein MKX01_007659 [Papaver californicum]
MVKRSSVIIRFTLLILLLQQVFIDTSNAEFTNNSRNKCSDSSSLIGECNEEVEMLMDSEVSRRFLAAQRHISYDAVAKDAPCSGGPGKPYAAKCPDPKKANDKNMRPCHRIFKCRTKSPGSN